MADRPPRRERGNVNTQRDLHAQGDIVTGV